MTQQTLLDRPHAKYSPSRLAIWQKCPGWVSDEKSSDAAMRGTRIGEAIAELIIGEPLPTSTPDYDIIMRGATMVQDFMDKLGCSDFEWNITAEEKLQTGVENCSGYADITAEEVFGDSALLIEIKTGFGDRDSAEESMQVAAYAAGLLIKGAERVYCCMIEVDKGTSTETIYMASDLTDIQDSIREIIDAQQNAIPDEYTHGSYCNYCGRAAECPKLTNALPAVVELLPTDIEPKEFAISLTPEELGEIMSRIMPIYDRADAYVGALRARAFQIIESGGEVPGWMVKYTSGNRKWTDEQAVINALTDQGINFLPFIELVSPAKVEKAIGKASKHIIEPYITKGAPKKSLQEVA